MGYRIHPELQAARNKLASAARRKDSDPEKVAQARAEFERIRPAAKIKQAIEDAPALTPEQAEQIAALLNAKTAA